jgi:hypothetical protein
MDETKVDSTITMEQIKIHVCLLKLEEHLFIWGRNGPSVDLECSLYQVTGAGCPVFSCSSKPAHLLPAIFQAVVSWAMSSA